VQDVYNALFPYAAEVCAVTQYRRRGAAPGGWAGHAAMFLNGAEIDATAGHPRLRLATDATALTRPDSGTGVSVNRIFENANWVAIPGREEFFHGRLQPGETLDEAFFEAAVRRATAAGWFAGLRVTSALAAQRPAAMPLEEFIVRHSIGTDFALTFARTAYSARLPVSREAMSKIIAYLNGANDWAREAGYTWNPYTNNCSHLIHNALAAAGIWDPKRTRGSGVLDVAKDLAGLAACVAAGRMSDFAFPANSFVRLYEAGNERPIDDAAAAFRNRDIVRTLRDSWITTAPGALVTTYPQHRPNALFAPGRDPLLFSVPWLWDKRGTFACLTARPPARFTDLGANLEAFRERYAAILARRGNGAEPRARRGEGLAFGAFAERFYAYIAQELRRTETRLGAFRRLTAASVTGGAPAASASDTPVTPPA
jgi:hypothetical protein